MEDGKFDVIWYYLNELLIFWQGNTTLSQGFIILIGLVIIYAYRKRLLLAGRFKRELRTLKSVEQNFDNQVQAIKATGDAQNKENPEIHIAQKTKSAVTKKGKNKTNPSIKQKNVEEVSINNLIEVAQKGSIIWERLNIFQEMRTSKFKISLELIQNNAFYFESQNKEFKYLKFAANLCILLGMFGTFIGLSIVVQEILGTLPEGQKMSEFLKATERIRGVMLGVKTAFSTTLVGLLGTILINNWNRKIENRINHYFQELESFTIKKLLPKTTTIDNLKKDELINYASIRIKDAFDNISDTINKNENIIKNLGNIQTQFSGIIEEVRRISQREQSEGLGNLIGQMNSVNGSIATMMKTYEQRLDNVSQLQETNEKQIKDLTKVLRQSFRFPEMFNVGFYVLIGIGVVLLAQFVLSIYNQFFIN